MKIFFLFNIILLSTLSIYSINNPVLIDFDTSMKKSYSWNPTYAKSAKLWNLVRELYKLNYINATKYQLKNSAHNQPRIPKIIHWIWLGSPLPEKYKKLQESWRKFNPGWEFKVWTDKDVEMFCMKNKKLFDKSKNWGQKSDIWRYEILYRYGGLYVDTDFECLKSFDLLHETCDFYVGIGYDLVDPYLYNGLFASISGHPILKECIEKVEVSGRKDPMAIIYETGPLLFTRCFFNNIGNLFKYKTVAFPVTFFYPLSNRDRNLDHRQKINRIQKESFAIHHYDTSWIK